MGFFGKKRQTIRILRGIWVKCHKFWYPKIDVFRHDTWAFAGSFSGLEVWHFTQIVSNMRIVGPFLARQCNLITDIDAGFRDGQRMNLPLPTVSAWRFGEFWTSQNPRQHRERASRRLKKWRQKTVLAYDLLKVSQNLDLQNRRFSRSISDENLFFLGAAQRGFFRKS